MKSFALKVLAPLSLALSTGCVVNNGNDAGSPFDAGFIVETPVLDGGSTPVGVGTLGGSLGFSPESATIQWFVTGDGGLNTSGLAILVSDMSRDALCGFDFFSGVHPPGNAQLASLYVVQDYADGGTLTPVSTGPIVTYFTTPVPAGLSGFGQFGVFVDGGILVAANSVDGGVTLNGVTWPTQRIGTFFTGGTADVSFEMHVADAQSNFGVLTGTLHASGCDYASGKPL